MRDRSYTEMGNRSLKVKYTPIKAKESTTSQHPY